MSSMNFLDKLLDGVEVEWKALGEIGNFIRGNGMQKKDFVEVGFPAIHYGQLYTRYGLSAENTFTFVPEALANRLKKAKRNDLLLATTSENDEDVVKPLAWLGEVVAISGDMMLFRHGQNAKYLAYFFQTNIFQEQKRKYITGAKVRRVSSGDLAKIVAPIPCPDNPKKSLEVQAKIVRILDTFTELTNELTNELTARKKQYNHYRDQLLSSEDRDVEWKTLGSLVDINTGSKPPEILESATSFDYINAGTSRSGYSAASNCSGDTVTTPSRGQGGIGYVGYQNKPFWLGPLCYKLRSTDLTVLINKYLFYFLQSRSEMLLGLKKEGGVPAVNKSDLIQLEIPVPSVEEQKQIVAILDKFDALTNSITEGLPREIELRQKQYAYYRDLLLCFPKPEAVEV
ncbi:restriction endonuclease subunit S [Aeromonas media]|uniref:restriction endonuclease subunit S n=1 Tax=Aeromonas TaxID=642 RepID=UPI0022E15ACE|nr:MULTISPECIES: restriction endonuclease subunit S [Aeromonas]WED82704.1 restriction endonuclease subunit S [Aeromonas media]